MASKTARVTWTSRPDVDGYNVYFSDGSGFTKLNSSPITSLQYDIPNLDEGSYTVYVTSVRGSEESIPSMHRSFTVTDSVTSSIEILHVIATSNAISIYFSVNNFTLTSLEYTLDGGQSWQSESVPSPGDPLVIFRSNENPVYIRLRGNGSILSDQTTQARAYTITQGGFDFIPSVTGEVSGMYNVHGVTDDATLSPPSLDPDDWELVNSGAPIVSHLDVIGKRKIDPVGFYLEQGASENLGLLYNSGWDDYADYRHGTTGITREATNQAGSLIGFDSSFSFVDFNTNPVLSWPQYAWQGRNRVNPYALVYYPPEQMFYCWYGDFAPGGDGDKYNGRRALGLARSKDLVNWVYMSVESPAFDIVDIHNIAPQDFPNTNFNNQGRLYAFGATFVDNEIYLQVGGSIAGTNYTTIIKSSNPTSGWQRAPHDNEEIARPMPIKIGNKWYSPRNIRDPQDDDKRAIAIRVYDDLESPGENHFIFATGFTASAGVSRQLFAHKGKWYVAYRQSDSDDYRDMHIAREK